MQLTVRDAARLLRVSESNVYRWIEDGEIPFCRVNDQVRLNRTDLLEWATARQMPISGEVFDDEGSVGDGPSLLAALTKGGVHAAAGSDEASVLRSVADHMPIADPADRELILAMLLAREESGAMVVTDGVAIPHVRYPVVLQGAPASVTVCFLERPVPFGPEKKPVDAVIAIISATIIGHLRLLARLAAAFHDPGFKSAISRKSATDIRSVIARLEEEPADERR